MRITIKISGCHFRGAKKTDLGSVTPEEIKITFRACHTAGDKNRFRACLKGGVGGGGGSEYLTQRPLSEHWDVHMG